jgi:hypothetical protein
VTHIEMRHGYICTNGVAMVAHTICATHSSNWCTTNSLFPLVQEWLQHHTHTHPRQCLSAYNTLLPQRPRASLAQPPAKKGAKWDTEPWTASRPTTNTTIATNSKVARTNAPQLIRLDDRRGNGRVRPNLGGVDERALTMAAIAPRGIPPGVEANTNASPNATIFKCHVGQPRLRLQEGNDAVAPPLPDLAKLIQGFPRHRGKKRSGP